MSLQHLWAGWRSTYILEATKRDRIGGATSSPQECVFCHLAKNGTPSEDNLIVWRGEHSYVVMNAYPYASGHMLVLPLRHVGSLSQLTQQESTEMWTATQDAIASAERSFDPDGLNMGSNLGRAAGAGIPAHVHLHVVPRWSGDTNFMTSIGDTRVLPEPLKESWKKLVSCWPNDGQASSL